MFCQSERTLGVGGWGRGYRGSAQKQTRANKEGQGGGAQNSGILIERTF